MRTLINILVKELLQLKRDPKILPILFVAPVVQLAILGYAATTDVRRVELLVCDLDRRLADAKAAEHGAKAVEHDGNEVSLGIA